MDDLFMGLVIVLAGNLVLGLARVMRGPTAADRMLAGEIVSTTTVVIVLLLWAITGRGALLDVALVFALLAALAVVIFVSRAWSAAPERAEGGPAAPEGGSAAPERAEGGPG